MSDIFVPGLRSRFNTEQLVEDLMRLERIPRDRTERNIESLESQRGWWQDIGRRITLMRESARDLFGFQNPFNERSAISSDSGVLSATATRIAAEQDASFIVRQLAQGDRFLSAPLDRNVSVDAGTYTFLIGEDEISFDFRGGSLREFADAVNRRGGGRLGATVMTVNPGTSSLLLESRVTGADNRLAFADDAAALAVRLGIIEPFEGGQLNLALDAESVRPIAQVDLVPISGEATAIDVSDGTVYLEPLSIAYFPLDLSVEQGSSLVLRLQTATRVEGDPGQGTEAQGEPAAAIPPPGPDVPSSGQVTREGITVANIPSAAPFPDWVPPALPPARVDELGVLSLVFADGDIVPLPPIADSDGFSAWEADIAGIAGGRTISALRIDNSNTHRDVMIRDATILDPTPLAEGQRPRNAISSAQDAIISMEGIEMRRPSNVIDDIVPGVTITARGVSDRPVRIEVGTNRELVKDAIIMLVGNYNRLMAEINILTRNDPSLIDELTYLSRDEAEAMRERLGAFAGDSSLGHLRNGMLRITGSPHPTDEGREMALLAQIGISTNARGTGFDPSRLRGYLEINEAMLDAALENNLHAVRQLFGSDTTGDMLTDSGVAFNLEALARPFVEMGGIISLKTGTIDSRIRQDTQGLASIDRRLEAHERNLRIQFGRMESAFSQMEQSPPGSTTSRTRTKGSP